MADRPVHPARPARERRLAVVRTDFFLPEAERLTEQERALMTAMLLGLVESLSDEIRVELPGSAPPVGEPDAALLCARLGETGLLQQDRLVALLLRRADEARVADQLVSGGATPRFVQGLVSHHNSIVAEAAMGLVLARGRRRDRFGHVGVDFADLDGDTAVLLAHALAAALAVETERGDEPFAHAADALLGRHDEGLRLEAIEGRLIAALQAGGELDDALLLTLADEGELGLLTAALAERAGISGDEAWERLSCPGSGRLAELLRIAAVTRPAAASLFAGIGAVIGLQDPAGEIGRFDQISGAQAEACRRALRLNPAYRRAADRLHGQRG
ncbi:DUF2336 domain-containing protein [Sphingomonas ginkgonis]|nr:DUF2336 domain-containing protein [Sphingomonas ginkgonis]